MAVEFKIPATVIPSLAVKEDINVIATLTANSIAIDSVGATLSLTTLLPTATIAFQADGQNFTHGLNVTAWTNNGTGGTTYDASTGGVAANEPVYDGIAADNPFKAPLGALYFADSSLSAWDYLNLANKFSTTGAFVMYAVFGYETGFASAFSPTLISTKSANSIGHSVNVLSKVTRTSTTVSIRDENYTALYSSLQKWMIATTEAEPTAAATPYVLVIRRDASGNMFCYDASSRSIVSSEQIHEVGFKLSFDAIGMAQPSLPGAAEGKGAYIAALGVFNSDIGSQKSQGLARLLGKKYIG